MVFYRDVECNEMDEVFSDCTFNIVGGNGDCANHSNDAGVICGKLILY